MQTATPRDRGRPTPRAHGCAEGCDSHEAAEAGAGAVEWHDNGSVPEAALGALSSDCVDSGLDGHVVETTVAETKAVATTRTKRRLCQTPISQNWKSEGSDFL